MAESDTAKGLLTVEPPLKKLDLVSQDLDMGTFATIPGSPLIARAECTPFIPLFDTALCGSAAEITSCNR